MYKVFPHANMSQQCNYYSQKFRLRKPVQLKPDGDEIIIKFCVVFAATKCKEKIEKTPGASSASPCSILRGGY